MKNRDHHWTQEEIEKIRSMRPDKSFNEIAAMFGVSRCSIAGIAARFKMPKKIHIKKILEKKVYERKPKQILFTLKMEGLLIQEPVSFLTRIQSQCSYIIGDARNMMCCGAPVKNNSYCAEHRSIVYVPARIHSARKSEQIPTIIEKR